MSVIKEKYQLLILGALVGLGLFLSHFNSYLLFHSLIELFIAVIAVCTFIVAWNTRKYIDNYYLLFIGIAYLFVGLLEAIHLLAYKGMGVFPSYSVNLPTQLWIAARFTESSALLIAPLFVRRKFNPPIVFTAYLVITLILIFTIFQHIFPNCYIPSQGLTTFKLASEYGICIILALSLLLLLIEREQFDPSTLRLIAASIILTIAGELCFTLYQNVSGYLNMTGHILTGMSFYLIYKAIIETSFFRPYDILYRNLKLSEAALREREALLQEVGQIAKVGGWELDAQNLEVRWTPETYRIHEVPLTYKPSLEDAINFYHPEEREKITAAVSQALATGEPFNHEFRFITARGQELWVQSICKPDLIQGKVIRIHGTFQDVSERRRAEDALREARDQLEQRVAARTADLRHTVEQLEWEIAERQRVEEALRESEERLRFLATQLLTAQESERQRLALELHDGLGQSLMVLKLQLRAVEKALAAPGPQAREGISECLNYINEVIENVRRMSRDLRPSALEDLGLKAALKSLFEEFSTLKGIRVSLDLEDLPGPLSNKTQVAIYRIFQESLTNIGKHAQATHIKVRIKPDNGMMAFQVEDNGLGFDPQEVLAGDLAQRGLGLAAMDERVRLLGGHLKISSQPGSGTRIAFTVPQESFH